MGVSAGVMIAEDDDLLGAAQLLAVSGSHFGFWPGWAAPSLLQVAGTPAAYSASASLSPSTIAMVSPAAMAASTSGGRYSTREFSRAQIARNTARRNRRPPFKGVEWHGRKWRARIFVDGRRIEIGTYPTPEEAPAEYDEAGRVHHGEFARSNEMMGLLKPSIPGKTHKPVEPGSRAVPRCDR